MEFSIVQTTCSSKEEAKALAQQLLDNKLAACIQITPIESLYIYEGVAYDETEYLLSIKTASRHYENIELFIKESHNYEAPEIIEVAINRGSKEYLQWVARALN